MPINHTTSFHQKKEMAKLMKDHGAAGYGAWWVLLEIWHEYNRNGIQIKATIPWLEDYAERIRFGRTAAMAMIDSLASLGMIDSGMLTASGIIEVAPEWRCLAGPPELPGIPKDEVPDTIYLSVIAE